MLDIQECPQADIAIGSLMIAVLQALCDERWTSFAEQSVTSTEDLATLLRSTIVSGPTSEVPAAIAKHFGYSSRITVGQLWHGLLQQLRPASPLLCPAVVEALQVVFQRGTLSQRILASLDFNFEQPTVRSIERVELARTYQKLSSCLVAGKLFNP